jgi:negative regulator of sigma E activity
MDPYPPSFWRGRAFGDPTRPDIDRSLTAHVYLAKKQIEKTEKWFRAAQIIAVAAALAVVAVTVVKAGANTAAIIEQTKAYTECVF